MDKPNILFLANTAHHTSAVTDHINAVTSQSRIHWHIINPIVCKTLDKIDFSLFDVIGVHYSIKPYDNYYLSQKLKNKIASFKGAKFIFLQDEYQKVNQVQDFLCMLGFDVLFTLVDNKLVNKAYPDPRLATLKKITVLTGYVRESMKSIISPSINTRSIDVSYRGREYAYWLGSLASEKQTIANEFIKRTQGQNLVLDISVKESDRVYGEAWLQLLMNSKAVLGTESGASIWDFDGTIQQQTNQYLRQHKKANFYLVYEDLLKKYEGYIRYNTISPRVFEAAATRTPMIMFPGEYSGICKPDKHYIMLEKNFSNLDEVLSKLKNIDYLQEIADTAYNDLIQSDLYSHQVLSNLVAYEILSLLSKQQQKNVVKDVSNTLENQINKYKTLNRLRCFYTEAQFILSNFVRLILDPKYTRLEKFKTLSSGMKRYIAYLLPRLKIQ